MVRRDLLTVSLKSPTFEFLSLLRAVRSNRGSAEEAFVIDSARTNEDSPRTFALTVGLCLTRIVLTMARHDRPGSITLARPSRSILG